MKNRHALLMIIIAGGLTVAGLGLIVANIFLRHLALMGAGMFCLAAMMLYVGWFQLRLAKKSGTLIPWWRHYQIVLGLFFASFGGIYFLLPLLDTFHFNEVIGNMLAIFYVVVVLAIGFYGIILTFKFAVEQRKKSANTLPKTQFRDQ
jgi:hypothetical protein